MGRLPGGEAKHAEFVANAPADIDWLVAEVARLRALLEPSVTMTSPHITEAEHKEAPHPPEEG